MGQPAHALASVRPLGYARRRPEETALYQTLQAHWGSFLARADAQGGLPKFVVGEVEAYLDCGILERGCALLLCERCGASRLLPFSCKRRGFCPSCCGRRCNDAALFLVERVLPEVPVRHWVCSLPWQLRCLLGYDRVLCAAVLSAFVTELLASYRRRAKRVLHLRSVSLLHAGAVTFVQRFDSALRLNVHAHTLVLDGVYVRDEHSGALRFVALPEPTLDEVTCVATRVAARIQKLLRKAGRYLDDERGGDDTQDALAAQEPVLAACYQAAAGGRQLMGQRAGAPALRLVGLPPLQKAPQHAGLLAQVRGVNIHAERAVDGRDRNQLERLCRYIARPPIAQDRLSRLPDGRVRYAMKRTWSDGTHSIVLEPLDFIARLCALIPPPRFHMLRFAGVLAAHHALRKEVVPACAPAPVCHKPVQLVLGFGDGVLLPMPLPGQEPPSRSRPARHGWAFLMAHVFAQDVLSCTQCQGRYRLHEVAFTQEAIGRVLARAGLGPRPPPRPVPNVACQLSLQLA